MPARNTRLRPDGWCTEQISVGASRERFFGGIKIDGEVFNVGDAVLVRCEDRKEPQVMRIDALWEDLPGRKWFEGRWFYRPEETTCGRLVVADEREIFETPWETVHPALSASGPS